jgi:hypothetical protein
VLKLKTASGPTAVSAVVPDTFVIPAGGPVDITDSFGQTYFGFTPDCDVADLVGGSCVALTFCGFLGGCSADLFFGQGFGTCDSGTWNVCGGDVPALGDGAFISCGTSFDCSGTLDLFTVSLDEPFYVGFTFTPAATTNTHYGYVELSVNETEGVTVYGWAYDSTPFTNVTTATVIPEPGTVTLLTGLLALVGVAVFRRRRSRLKAVAAA